jgi:L(+)-tartrate dehydratase beta subunit
MVNTPSRLQQHRLSLPPTPEEIAALAPGDIAFLSGTIYTAREGVYKRVLEEHAGLPVERELLNTNFHCSPAAALQEDGTYKIGGVTATASFRFSKFMDEWLSLTGSRIIIGKGGMPREDYKNILVPHKAVYLTTVGYGTGALLGRGIKGVRAVHWLKELGIAQAMWLFEVENLGPFIVDSDLKGNSLFVEHGDRISAGLPRLYEGLVPPALHRYGETDNRKDEVM